MRMIPLAIPFVLLGAATALSGAEPKDLDALQGSWQLVAGEADGQPIPEAQLKGSELLLKGDRYSVTLAGKAAVTGMQKLDPSKDPKAIDITDDSGPNKGKTCLGIYELKGDRFWVVFAAPGNARPSRFATEPNKGQWMHVWKRVK